MSTVPKKASAGKPERADPAGLPAPQPFLAAVFQPADLVLVRPIETWTEAGKKSSRVIYRSAQCYKARELMAPKTFARVLEVGAQEQANLFFGVCPRQGGNGQYDLAWQIRTVRVLWADIDHCTVEEALKRCEAAGLPPPSVVVRSGHGVHLYWILAEPYLVDDAGDPPPVHVEFIDQGPGKKKRPRRYIKRPDGEVVYEFLSDGAGGTSKIRNPEFPKLSAKGLHVQHVIAGIAARVGGDHTTDLARLLRLPGTLNRKDERNGKPPVPCELAECDPARRYPFADFERFAECSPAKARAAELAKIRLPRQNLTPRRRNKLSEYLNACMLAEDRSRADFAAICYAIREGFDREVVWQEVAEVGKFAERGRDYFDRTWENAESEVRETLYARLCRTRRGKQVNGDGGHTAGASNGAPAAPADAPPAEPPPGPAGDGGDGRRDGPPESVNDPHRLARQWLGKHATHPERPTALYYREQPWRWRGNRWVAVPDAEMRAQMAHFAKRQLDEDFAGNEAAFILGGKPPEVPQVTRDLVTNTLQALAGEVLLPQEVAQPVWLGEAPEHRNVITLANGLLDVDALLAGKGDVLHAHTPRWFSPVCLPYRFDPDADCPRWKALLKRNLADDRDKITLLQQFAGYLLLPDTSHQRFLMMLGDGSNGKSVACAVLTGLLGVENISSVPLEMFGDRFRLVGTLGKLANIVAEVGELDKIAEGQVKAFVVGDLMEFERKFKAPFMARPTARLVLATNNAPQFSDKTDGVWRRMLPLHFTVQIPEGERIAGMDKPEYWQASGELPGIMNWALAGLAELRRQGRFVVPKSVQEVIDRLRTEANPARRFLDEHYQDGPGAVICAKLYEDYRSWCRDHGHHAMADIGFGREVARKFPKLKRGKASGTDGKRHNCYCGVEERPADHTAGLS